MKGDRPEARARVEAFTRHDGKRLEAIYGYGGTAGGFALTCGGADPGHETGRRRHQFSTCSLKTGEVSGRQALLILGSVHAKKLSREH